MDESEKALTAYTKIAEQIAREDNIIHQRTTSGLSVNAVLATLAGGLYSVSRNYIEKPQDFVVVMLVLCILAFIAIWVSFSTIRFISYARTQNAYLKEFYLDYWKDNVERELNLPRPFGYKGQVDRDKDDRIIRDDAGRAGALLRAIIAIWVVCLIILTITMIKWLLQ